MAFWWVNHKQTFKMELENGYIWSPTRKKNGGQNQTYLNLTRTSIGDVIFSYADGKIKAIGKTVGRCEESPLPEEFGHVGQQWDNLGWLVRVQWNLLSSPFAPKDYLQKLNPLLPAKYSPIQSNGNGNQGVYLAEISDALGETLLSLIGQGNVEIEDDLASIDELREENKQEDEVVASNIPSTQKQQIVLARIGQGLFRLNLEKVESRCRVTGLSDKRFLIASHIKPWRDSTNEERLDGQNGFLLSPHVDKLFDRGWISFSDDGLLLISSQEILSVLQNWGINSAMSLGKFKEKQKAYLDYHRKKIFKG